jgi:hypothetical protein
VASISCTSHSTSGAFGRDPGDAVGLAHFLKVRLADHTATAEDHDFLELESGA